MENKVLKTIIEKQSLEVIEPINPKEFFQDRKGLFVWSSFKEKVVSKAEPVEKDLKLDFSSFKLLENSDDEEIEKSLPEQHLFTETELSALIATLIKAQSKGEEGVLLNDGHWNLFYTPSCVVSVDWSRFSGYWFVDAWDRDGYVWGAVRRVFSPATNL